MKVIISGSRNIIDTKPVKEAVEEAPFEISELIHGGAKGVDTQAANLREIGWNPLDVKTVRKFEPDWDEHGKAAGPIRNNKMANYADALIAVWDGQSNGTKNMIENAIEENLQIYVKNLADKNKKNGDFE